VTRFDDGKDKDALRTIGEVSEALGIKPHILRYWEQHFPMLQPLKRSGGRRYYRPADIAMVEAIARLVNTQGYTIKGAKAVLRREGSSAGQGASSGSQDASAATGTAQLPDPSENQPEQVLTPAVEQTIARLKTLRTKLARAIES